MICLHQVYKMFLLPPVTRKSINAALKAATESEFQFSQTGCKYQIKEDSV